MRKLMIKIYLAYIRFFAKLRLKIVNPTIIGIGGASGKSSISKLVKTVLAEKYSVHSSDGRNSETGIPLDILDIKINKYNIIFWIKSAIIAPFKVVINKNTFDFYVVEMGIDSPHPPKNMSYLLTILKPDIGVLSNIGIEHSVYFDALVDVNSGKNRKDEILEIIAEEESLLLTTLNENSKAVINLDDDLIKNLLPLNSNTIKVSNSAKNLIILYSLNLS